MNFDAFAKQVSAAGLVPINHGNGHWQIRGGPLIVNYYPSTGTIFVNKTAGKRGKGRVEEAIAAAQVAPPLSPAKKCRRIGFKAGRTIKRRLFNKSNLCHWCGQPMRWDQASLEHIVPLARGGSNCLDNLALAHRRCNTNRGCDMPEIGEPT